LYCRKKLKKGVLLYIHFNLALALLLAMVVFVAGVETASFNMVRKDLANTEIEIFTCESSQYLHALNTNLTVAACFKTVTSISMEQLKTDT